MKIFNKEISNNNLIITVLIVVIMLLAKCNHDSNNEYKKLELISQNNIEVLNDSINNYRTVNGSLIQERGVLIATEKELKDLNMELFQVVDDLKKELPNKSKPQLVIKTVTELIHDTTYLDASLLTTNDSSHTVNFSKDTTYSENNYRKLAGTIDFNLISDSCSVYNSVKLGDVKITKDEMKMDATLVLGTKDDKLKVWLKSDYPGFNAESIDAVTLDPDIHPELRKLNNKKFSVGPYIGIGVGQNFTLTPSIGVGFQYNLLKF